MGGSRLSPEQLEFVGWLVNPERVGDQRSWAREHGFHEVTLSRWKRDPVFIEAWYSAMDRVNVTPDRVTAVLDALWREAAGGHVQAGKAYLEYVREFGPSRRQEPVGVGLGELSDEVLGSLLADAAFDESEVRLEGRVRPADEPQGELEGGGGL